MVERTAEHLTDVHPIVQRLDARGEALGNALHVNGRVIEIAARNVVSVVPELPNTNGLS